MKAPIKITLGGELNNEKRIIIESGTETEKKAQRKGFKKDT